MTHHLRARAVAALTIAGTLAAATAGVRAQAPPPGAPPAGPAIGAMMGATDAEFVRAIAGVNTAELDAAKYVVNRTADPAVRAFAQRMIDDHSTAAVELQAGTRGTALFPAPPETAANPMGRMSVDMLRGDNGVALDRDYMRMQVPAHRIALHFAQWEVDNGQAPGLRALAGDLVPVIRQHLQIAQNYLADHNLSPFSPPEPMPIPGHVMPNGPPPGPGTPNNPAAPGSSTSTQGQNNAGGGTVPSQGTAPASPAPATPHP